MRTSLVLLSARLLDPLSGELLPNTALAVSGGRISDLGDDRRIRRLADSATTVIDLKGAVVTPGLVDGHLHPLSGADLTRGLDLSGCTGLDEVKQALAGEVRTLAPGAWLHGWGLDPNVFGDRPVAAAALAPVLDGVPALLQLFDAHSMLASARHRRPSRDLTQPPHGPEQALTPLEALQGMTLNPAYAAGEEAHAVASPSATVPTSPCSRTARSPWPPRICPGCPYCSPSSTDTPRTATRISDAQSLRE
ncbi:amidohydrolase family protein [Streptomyces sp. NPDC087849]|uniref:amidohydrolase family protein n=1 Tax=Streptomyces sp. NPDC087849 TaxID=3365808 RepID=UPI003816ABE3